MDVKCENSPSSEALATHQDCQNPECNTMDQCEDTQDTECTDECQYSPPTVKRGQRKSAGRVVPRYKTRSTKATNRARRKIVAARTRSRRSSIGKSRPPSSESICPVPKENVVEPPATPKRVSSVSTTPRLLVFPNAAQNIPTYGAEEHEVRVEFTVRQSDLPKLTELLGEPIVEQMVPEVNNHFHELGDVYQDPCQQYAVSHAAPTCSLTRQHRCRQPSFCQAPPICDSLPNYAQTAPTNGLRVICPGKVTLQRVKYYYNQLAPQDQQHFIDEMSIEVKHKEQPQWEAGGVQSRTRESVTRRVGFTNQAGRRLSWATGTVNTRSSDY